LAKQRTSTRAKWRSSMSARCRVLEKNFDTADIVREACLEQFRAGAAMGHFMESDWVTFTVEKGRKLPRRA